MSAGYELETEWTTACISTRGRDKYSSSSAVEAMPCRSFFLFSLD